VDIPYKNQQNGTKISSQKQNPNNGKQSQTPESGNLNEDMEEIQVIARVINFDEKDVIDTEKRAVVTDSLSPLVTDSPPLKPTKPTTEKNEDNQNMSTEAKIGSQERKRNRNQTSKEQEQVDKDVVSETEDEDEVQGDRNQKPHFVMDSSLSQEWDLDWDKITEVAKVRQGGDIHKESIPESNKSPKANNLTTPSPRLDSFASLWDIMFYRLSLYKQQHGHCNVPLNWGEDRKLSSWAQLQRRLQNNNVIQRQHFQQLDEIGFWERKSPWAHVSKTKKKVTFNLSSTQ